MKKTFWSLAWVTLACLLLVFCTFVALARDASLFHALALWCGALLIILIFRSLLSLGVLAADSPLARRLWAWLYLSRKEYLLREHWRAGASTLKRLNRLGRQLPWYVFIGTRNGKTSLLDGAQVPVLSHLTAREQVTPTRTLKWWFFKSLCVLDIASGFSNDTQATARSWKRLTRWSKRLPAPEGVLVSISCAELQGKSVNELHHQGRALRVQLERLLLVHRRRLPIHIIITGLETQPGFEAWQQTLSCEQREHALGHQWQEPPVVDRNTAYLRPLFYRLNQGLLTHGVGVLDGARPTAMTAERLAFRDQLLALEAPLSGFIVALCEPDPYHRTGVLKGVWLTANAVTPDSPNQRMSHFVKQLLCQRLSSAERAERFGFLMPPPIWALALLLATGLLYSGFQTHRLRTLEPAPGIPADVSRLQALEHGLRHPLKYLPYLPLINHWYAAQETKLLATRPWPVAQHQARQDEWQHEFETAPPAAKRALIIQLSETLQLLAAMEDNRPLPELRPLYRDTPFLPLTINNNSVEERLAITRAWLQRNSTAWPLVTLRRLLLQWVTHDPQWAWLLAERGALPALHTGQYWVASDDDATLSGVWTHAGEQALTREVELITQALGADSQATFEPFWRSWPQRRQDAWLAFVHAAVEQAQGQLPHRLTNKELIALANGQDPASRFMTRVTAELDSIAGRHSQPWLKHMRRIAHLQRHWQAVNLHDKASTKEQWLRGWVYRAAGSANSEAYGTLQNIEHWQAWKASVANTVNVMLKQGDDTRLTVGLFSNDAEPADDAADALQTLHAAFIDMKERVTASAQGADIAWDLLATQLDILAASAMTTKACALQARWQHEVLAPLGASRVKHNANRQAELAWTLFQNFVKTHAMPYLTQNPGGWSAKRAYGLAVPFSVEFLHTLNRSTSFDDIAPLPERTETYRQDEQVALKEQLQALEANRVSQMQAWSEVSIATQPVTIPGGAALMPIGTRLTLRCANEHVELSSLNLREEREFRWAPGQCESVSLSVMFPHTELTRTFRGPDAWPTFLQTFISGEQTLRLDDFDANDQQASPLPGDTTVLVRFAISGHEALIERWQALQALNDVIDELQARIALPPAPFTEHQNYFFGNLASLPVSVTQCPKFEQ